MAAGKKTTPVSEGMPFSLLAGVSLEPERWFAALPMHAKLLREMRPALSAVEKQHLSKAERWAIAAIDAADAGDAHGALFASSQSVYFAFLVELSVGAVYRLQRDKARQDGTRKKRRADIDEWIRRALEREPGSKSPELWKKVPEEFQDVIGVERFAKRVTAVRKISRK